MAADKSVKVGLDTSGVKKGATDAKSAIEDVRKSMKAWGADTAGIDKLQKAFEGVASKIKGISAGGVAGGLLAGGQMLASAIGALVSVAAKAAEKAIELTQAGAELAIKFSQQRQGFEGGANKFLKNSAAAAALYEKMTALAIKLGMTQEDALEKAKSMLNAGFKFSQIEKLVTLINTMKKGAGEGAAAALEAILTKIQATGKLDAKAIKALAAQGVSTTAIYDALAKAMGKSRQEIERMVASGGGPNIGAVAKAAHTSVEAVQKAVDGGKKGLDELAKKSGLTIAQIKNLLKSSGGTIDSGSALKALEDVLNKKFGAGSKAEVPDSIKGLINAIKIKFNTLFDSVDLGGIKKALKAVFELFKGPEMKALKQSITLFFKAIFDSIGNLVGGAQSGGATQTAKNMITALAKALQGAAVWIKQNQSKIKEFAQSAAVLARAVVDIALAVAKVLVALAALIVQLTKTEQRFQQVKNIGSAMVQGIVNGITGGAASIISALVSAVMAAVKAAKAALGIASPSKVFAGIGANTAAGMAQGMNAGAGGVAAAAKGMAAGAAASAQGASGSILGGKGGGAGGGNKTINAHFEYHPQQLNFPTGTTPAQAGQMTQAALQAGKAEFDSHMGDFMRRMSEG